MPTATHDLTAEEAISLHGDPDVHGYEFVNGQLEPVSPANALHGRTIARLAQRLLNHVDHHGGGEVFIDAGFVLGLEHDPRRMRGPDVAFMSSQRIADAGGVREEGFFRGVPDLAAEIFSPTNQDQPGQFEQRLRDLLDAGVRILWVIYPIGRFATVYHLDGSARLVRDTESLSGEDVLPGLAIPLDSLLA